MNRKTKMGAVLAAVLVAIGGAASLRAAEPADATGGMLGEYGKIHDALADDRADGVATAAAKLADLAKDAGAGCSETCARVAAAAGAMTGADLAALRNQMKELSKAMAAVAGASADIYYCPMVDAYWLQKKGEAARNPYYGKSMSRCGAKVQKVEG